MSAAAAHAELVRELAATPRGALVTCAGSSMEPTIPRGETVRVFAGERARSGDVILFHTADGRSYVLHRLVCTIPGTRYFLHLGDAGRKGGLGIGRREQIIGRADVPRRRPGTATLFTMARAALRTRPTARNPRR